jgi:hypothetical protein
MSMHVILMCMYVFCAVDVVKSLCSFRDVQLIFRCLACGEVLLMHDFCSIALGSSVMSHMEIIFRLLWLDELSHLAE